MKIIRDLRGKLNWNVLFIGGISLLTILFYLMNRDVFNSVFKGDIDSIKTLYSDHLFYAFLFMFIVMIVQNTFTIIPLILVITINITLFGFLYGFIWSWISSVLAAIFVFFSIRYIFQGKLVKKFSPDLIAKIEKDGFKYVFQARIFPFVPTSLVNILAGLSLIPFFHFLLGTTFGNFLYFLVLSLIPIGLFSTAINGYVMGIIIVVIFILFYVFRRVFHRKSRNPFFKTNRDQ